MAKANECYRGDKIRYFRRGIDNGQWDVAFAMSDTEGKCTNILVLPSAGGATQLVRGVYHLHDSDLLERPNIRNKRGAWDHFVERAADSDEERILEWAERYSFATVCQKARPRGLSEKQVREIYERNELEVNPEVVQST